MQIKLDKEDKELLIAITEELYTDGVDEILDDADFTGDTLTYTFVDYVGEDSASQNRLYVNHDKVSVSPGWDAAATSVKEFVATLSGMNTDDPQLSY